MQELTATDFIRLDRPPPLGHDEIHLCAIALPGTARPHEVAAAAREALDRLLRDYTGATEAPPVLRGAHGKPHAPAAGGLEFNLSHAGPHVLFAFARGQALGVDIERDRPRLSVLGLARRFFDTDEANALEALPEAVRREGFLRLWTRKEAVLKALGQGLNFGLHRLAFSLEPDGTAGPLHRIAEEAGRVDEWRLQPVRPAAGLVGALAWRGPSRRVRAFSLAT